MAAANILAGPLRDGAVTDDHLAAVQKRRTLPMRVIQWIQVQVQNRILTPVLASTARPAPPWLALMFNRFPLLRRLPARLIGMGIRPEHVRTPDVSRGRRASAPSS